jgi:hypothetical protein
LFTGDRRRIDADEVGQARNPARFQRPQQFSLDLADEPKPTEHQTGIELDQAGAGPQLRDCRSAGIDATI